MQFPCNWLTGKVFFSLKKKMLAKNCMLYITIYKKNDFHTVLKKIKIFCELPDCKCQTTGRCVWHPASNETPGRD